MIYDYLFYKSFQFAKRNEFWTDIPVMYACMWVGFCFILNFFTLFLIVDTLLGSNISVISEYLSQMGYLSGVVLAALLFYYYGNKSRWKKIIEKHEQKEKLKKRNIHPLVVILLFVIVSTILGSLAAMYKRGDFTL